MLKKLFLTLFLFIQIFAFKLNAANSCYGLFKSREIEKIEITSVNFERLLSTLRATLSGNLATVWRSEWKTKLSVLRSNHYVYNLLKQNLSETTFAVVTSGLFIADKGFVRMVHQRLNELQKNKKTNVSDLIAVRDAPPPAGATDSTFTYYTKPIVDANGVGKHQIRARTYLRAVDFSAMNINEAIEGFFPNGHKVKLTQLKQDLFELKINDATQLVSKEELVIKFGSSLQLFAPHGGAYKLEVKSALEEIISSPKFDKLNGPHDVQKLDISLTFEQFNTLFAPLKSKTKEAQVIESMARLNHLKTELRQQSPQKTARIDGVISVLETGLNSNPNFLEIEGATSYHRTAFESSSGFQTTIDRDQGVYVENMYSSGSIKNPLLVIQKNIRLVTGDEDARHVELKLPINLVVDALGVQFPNSTSKSLVQHVPFSNDAIEKILILYSHYVTNVSHPGKFNYLIQEAANFASDFE